ncbi:MAG TPA: hypothetical protein VIG74_02620 [Alphaproteobacteria bacterium]
MTNSAFKRSLLTRTAIACAIVVISAAPGVALAKAAKSPPPLVITDEPLPAELQNKIYSRPSRVPDITPAQVSGGSYFKDSDIGTTVVSRKVDDLRNDLFSLQGKVSNLSEMLAKIETNGQSEAAEYYASIATISTQLQSGTTPGNPRLVEKLGVARDNLEKLSGNIAKLNDLAMEISNTASMSAFLLESARAAYGLSGAIEEDHVRLAQLEDAVNSTVVVIDRLLNNVNDDITRTVAYIGSERENLRTLSLAITTGDLFGKSLSNRPFSGAHLANFTPSDNGGMGNGGIMPQPASFGGPAPQQPAALPGGPRPLVKIRFDRPDVAYEQPVYMAVNEAMARYPQARFELVAVHPSKGNAAEVAIESTRARRNAERVLRSLTQMGLDLDRIDLSYMPSTEATTSEVNLYVR